MDIQERINAYWSKRADEFGDARYADMQGERGKLWKAFIARNLPDRPSVRALDLGTGAGLFAFIMTDLGCKVTGIDYSEDMLRNARANAEKLGFTGITFLQMDAQDLQFPDGQFDLIFTRNVTWTLPDPEKAYREMARVLVPGGRIINADANYARAFNEFDRTGQTEKQAENSYGGYQNPARSLPMLRERNDIARSLYIAEKDRPLWDIDILMQCGMQRFSVDLDINRHEFGAQMPAGTVSLSPEFVIIADKI